MRLCARTTSSAAATYLETLVPAPTGEMLTAAIAITPPREDHRARAPRADRALRRRARTPVRPRRGPRGRARDRRVARARTGAAPCAGAGRPAAARRSALRP